MKLITIRPLRAVPACVIAAASIAALAGPTTASASLGTQCSGGPITGQGAAVEIVAQRVWTSNFNKSTDKLACSGKQGSKESPVVTYDGTSSGAGLKSWGESGTLSGPVTGFAANNAFVATAEAPNATQEKNIINQESTPTEKTLETLPVAQFALAVYVNLPAGCTATSTPASGRLVLSDATLQAIFAGTITTWGEITDSGDTITGTGCATDPIKAVVRKEKAGTTNVLKKYLYLINKASLTTPSGSETWQKLSEGSTLNVVWPTALSLVKTTAEGDNEEAKKVSETPGSIGYSNLAELRETALFSGTGNGAGTGKFWVEVENGSKGSGAKTKVTYADPATNGDVGAAASANCKSTGYTNGANPFPPPSVTGLWNEVTTAVPPSTVAEKSYSLCNFTYVLAFTSYSLLPSTTPGEATSVNNFLRFIADKKGGQAELPGADYLGVPKGAVDSALVSGAGAIGF